MRTKNSSEVQMCNTKGEQAEKQQNSAPKTNTA